MPLRSPCFVDPERPNDYQRWLHEGLGRCGRGLGRRVGERAQRSVSVGANAVQSHGASRERGLDRVHRYRILGTSRAGFLSAACCRGQARGARAAAALSWPLHSVTQHPCPMIHAACGPRRGFWRRPLRPHRLPRRAWSRWQQAPDAVPPELHPDQRGTPRCSKAQQRERPRWCALPQHRCANAGHIQHGSRRKRARVPGHRSHAPGLKTRASAPTSSPRSRGSTAFPRCRPSAARNGSRTRPPLW